MRAKRTLAGLIIAVLAAGCTHQQIVGAPSPGTASDVRQSSIAFGLTTRNVLAHYPLPNADSGVFHTALGSDKNVWFTELNASRVGKITPTGAITEYNLPSGHFGADIAAGATGTLWLAEYGSGFIAKVATTGAVTEFPLPANVFAEGIAKGPDGNMWFTDSSNNAIGRITPTGTVTEFPLPVAGEHPYDITAGPDGNLWFVDVSNGLVGKVTTGGSITEFKGPGDTPTAIAKGPDGNLYAASYQGIWQITTAGTIKVFPSSGATVWLDIILGPDGQLWMTSEAFGALIEFNPKTLTFSPFIQPDIVNGSPGQLDGLSVGADGDVWIAGSTGNDIMVYEEKVFAVGVRLIGETSFDDPNYGFELGYARGTGTQTQTVLLGAGETVQFQNLDTIPHSAAFLGDATAKSAPWPAAFNGSTTPSPAGTAIGTAGFATGSLAAGKKSLVYETGAPGFYMFGCQYHYNADEMRTVIIVH